MGSRKLRPRDGENLSPAQLGAAQKATRPTKPEQPAFAELGAAWRTDERAARRLHDGARAAFTGDYLREHITHGYAVTVRSAQGVTADTAHAVLGETPPAHCCTPP